MSEQVDRDGRGKGVAPVLTLITGATGYIGSRLARRLLASGSAVRGLVLPSESGNASELASLGMQVWTGDLLSLESLRGITSGVSYVYHLAGDHGASIDYTRRVYLDGTLNLVQACRADGCPRAFIAASNGSVYGDGGDLWVTEEYKPESIPHPFGLITGEVEQLLLSAYAQEGFPCTILRIAEVYGPGSYHVLEQLRRGRVHLLGESNAWTSHVHVDDVLAVLSAASGLRLGQVYNLADDLPARSREFYTYAASVAGAQVPRWIPRERVPPRIWQGVPGLRSFSLRMSNCKMRSEIPIALVHPTYLQGLAHLAGA